MARIRSTSWAAKVSKPRAPPVRKVSTPFWAKSKISSRSLRRTQSISCSGMRRWPVKQQHFSRSKGFPPFFQNFRTVLLGYQPCAILSNGRGKSGPKTGPLSRVKLD